MDRFYKSEVISWEILLVDHFIEKFAVVPKFLKFDELIRRYAFDEFRAQLYLVIEVDFLRSEPFDQLNQSFL